MGGGGDDAASATAVPILKETKHRKLRTITLNLNDFTARAYRRVKPELKKSCSFANARHSATLTPTREQIRTQLLELSQDAERQLPNWVTSWPQLVTKTATTTLFLGPTRIPVIPECCQDRPGSPSVCSSGGRRRQAGRLPRHWPARPVRAPAIRWRLPPRGMPVGWR